MLMKYQDGKFYLDFSMRAPPNVGGMNGYVQSNISTLEFNNGEQLEDFNIRIIRLQQEMILSGETVSPTRLIFR